MYQRRMDTTSTSTGMKMAVDVHFRKIYILYIQLIYDFKDKGSSIGLITLHPDEIPHIDKEQFLKMGVEIPSMRLVE